MAFSALLSGRVRGAISAHSSLVFKALSGTFQLLFDRFWPSLGSCSTFSDHFWCKCGVQVPIGDSPTAVEELREILDWTYSFIDNARAAGGGVVVHCNMGTCTIPITI